MRLTYSSFSFILTLALVVVLVILALYWAFCGATPDPWAMQRFSWALQFTVLFILLGILGFLLERRAVMGMLAGRVGENLLSPRM